MHNLIRTFVSIQLLLKVVAVLHHSLQKNKKISLIILTLMYPMQIYSLENQAIDRVVLCYVET